MTYFIIYPKLRKEGGMKKSKKCIFVLVFVLVSVVMLPNAYAAGWSNLMKVTHTSTGVSGTYVYGSTAFPSGSTISRILYATSGHSRMLATILTAISLDKYIRFYVDDNGYIIQALIYN